MEITNLDTVRQIGEEYGWNDHQIEMALSTAIRMCYLEHDMLVEVDVNMQTGTIAARRRNGYGDRGVWIDINKPLLPSVSLFMHVMELMQWADGAPGRVLEGTVAGYRDGGVLYRTIDNLVIIPENLLSVMDYHQRPEVGDTQVIALCASYDDVSGLRVATRRGQEFVAAVTETFYPDCITGIWMGASNSWAVIRMHPDDMGQWLENGGVNVKHLQQTLGLRRITLIPEGEGESQEEREQSELRHFVNNAWKDCRIAELTPERIVLHTPLGDSDPRKMRTFTSMLKKIAPQRDQVIL
tara:strand:+ start:796 stop:1686 length:891 start_codon:yes stop_codon:yes gene_type:complete